MNTLTAAAITPITYNIEKILKAHGLECQVIKDRTFEVYNSTKKNNVWITETITVNVDGIVDVFCSDGTVGYDNSLMAYLGY